MVLRIVNEDNAAIMTIDAGHTFTSVNGNFRVEASRGQGQIRTTLAPPSHAPMANAVLQVVTERDNFAIKLRFNQETFNFLVNTDGGATTATFVQDEKMLEMCLNSMRREEAKSSDQSMVTAASVGCRIQAVTNWLSTANPETGDKLQDDGTKQNSREEENKADSDDELSSVVDFERSIEGLYDETPKANEEDGDDEQNLVIDEADGHSELQSVAEFARSIGENYVENPKNNEQDDDNKENLSIDDAYVRSIKEGRNISDTQ